MNEATQAIARSLAKKTDMEKSNEKENRWTVLAVVVLLTACTRYYKVTEPDHVCWDETHFGKMGSWYINRTFFFDVHPPLGKMLIGLSGYLTGYNGTYPFEKPGDKYNGTRYEGMRYFCTTLGALVIPMAFDAVYELSGSTEAAAISAAYLIFDVGLLTLNRYILLDPILLFFMVASVWGMVKVSKCTANDGSFRRGWWFWLLFTGSMLSCTISVKFVGLFVVLLVGLHTIYELWTILGDLRKPIIVTFKQIACRAVALILWPFLLYLLFFYVHLAVLNRSGNGDGFYSSAFQSRLIGNSLYNASMPRHLAYGAVVTIKNHKTGGGYLHSHYHLYPKGVGARQQQITTYTHKDDNNKWILKPHNKTSFAGVRLLRHGDLVRFEHLATKRNLHTHAEPAPVTKRHLQVTGYGEEGLGDANDIWRILIAGGKPNETIKTVSTKFLLVHYLQNCALTASGVQLPKWGFEQQEVSCNPNIRDGNAYWNVETNINRKLPSVNFSVYAPGFFARFMESHAVMFQGNAGLKPKEGEVTSRPWQWPINYRGQFFSASSPHRVYLLGNPVVWWSNLVFLALFLIVFIVTAIRKRRQEGKRQLRLRQRLAQEQSAAASKSESMLRAGGQGEYSNNYYDAVAERERNANDDSRTSEPTLAPAVWLYVGWVLHYLPFWAMGRVLYYHHYFPALVFNSMLTGVMFHYITRRLPNWLRHALLGVLLAVLAGSFVAFSPLAYGMAGPMATERTSTLYSLHWLSSWEF